MIEYETLDTDTIELVYQYNRIDLQGWVTCKKDWYELEKTRNKEKGTYCLFRILSVVKNEVIGGINRVQT